MTTPNETPANRLLAAALDYARRGWPVFPLKPREKVPATAHGFKDASTDDSTIRGWWAEIPDANVGVVCGQASGLAVIDLDRHGPDDGVAVAEALHGWAPTGPYQATGGGGLQAFYRCPPGGIKTRASINPGVELRGDGAYVVVPPSIHPSGVAYAWQVGPDDEPLPDVPSWALNAHKAAVVTPSPNDGTISEGRRNSTLTSLAGAMRKRGATVESILAALNVENRERCTPPLDDAEVQRIAASVGRYPPAGVDPLTFRLTDSGNAELLAALYAGRLRYDVKRGRWLHWQDGAHRWHDDGDAPAVGYARDAARLRYQMAGTLEPDQRKPHSAWATLSESKAKIDAALHLASRLPEFRDDGPWDADPYLLCVENGVIDLRTGELREGKPEDRMTIYTPIVFDPTAVCPRWERFLDEVFEDDEALVDFVWRAVGYSLSGLTKEQILFILWGSGANGKSVFLKILRLVLGDYALDTPFTTFDVTARCGIPNDVAALAGRRLVTASESNENVRLNEARIKALTGGDAMTARFLHGEFFTFTPVCKILLATNHKPRVTDDSYAFWRRVRLIPFTRQFRGEDADQNLADTLAAEAPGILAWAVRGVLRWAEVGLEPPEAVTKATETYEAESDPLAGFIEDRCTVGPERQARAADLYRGYRAWGERNGLRDREIMSNKTFGSRMGQRFKGRHTSGGKVYDGISLSAGDGEM